MPAVSIITPTYNRAGHLSRTVRCVLAQTFADFEWIIVDDGSTDGTEELIKSSGDSRISYFKREHTGWLPSVRNFGISQAKGEYIMLLDSDDEWAPGLLYFLHRMLDKRKDTGFAISNARIVENGKEIYSSVYLQRHFREQGRSYLMDLFTDELFVIFPSCIMMRKSLVARCGGFDERLKYGEKDLFTRLSEHTMGFINPEVLVTINRHGANASAGAARGSLAEESFREELHTLGTFYKNKWIERKFYRKMSGLFWFKLAEFYYRHHHFKDAGEAYRVSLSYRLFQPKAMAKFMLSKAKS
jgi:glycosyltransferase involved in cell wall biosynthesis